MGGSSGRCNEGAKADGQESLKARKNRGRPTICGIKADLYKRYMDDVARVASCSEENLPQFLEYASSFHPNLEYMYTWSVSTDKLPFLDIRMKPQGNRLATSIHYKATDSHS